MKCFLNNFAKRTGEHLCQILFFNKVTGLRQFLFCEFCEIFKNICFLEHLQRLGSEDITIVFLKWIFALISTLIFFFTHYRLTHYNPVLLFYTPWKHQKTFRFSDVYRGYRKATLGCNGIKLSWFCQKN